LHNQDLRIEGKNNLSRNILTNGSEKSYMNLQQLEKTRIIEKNVGHHQKNKEMDDTYFHFFVMNI
jgi:hypothetical protein